MLPRADFAALHPTGKPFEEMLSEAYGKTAAEALVACRETVVERTESHLIQSRPDLSCIPEP